MDALTNLPPLADRLALQYEDLQTDIAKALAGLTAPAIVSNEDVAVAREIIKPLKALQGTVERTRVDEKAPLLADERTVDDFFRDMRAALDQMVTDITKNATDYQTKKRQDALKLEAAKARIATAVGDAPPTITAPKETTRVVAASGAIAASGRVTWDYEVTDASLLPRDLLTPNKDAIKAKVAGIKAQGTKITDAVVPGLRIFEKVGTTWR